MKITPEDVMLIAGMIEQLMEERFDGIDFMLIVPSIDSPNNPDMYCGDACIRCCAVRLIAMVTDKNIPHKESIENKMKRTLGQDVTGSETKH